MKNVICNYNLSIRLLMYSCDEYYFLDDTHVMLTRFASYTTLSRLLYFAACHASGKQCVAVRFHLMHCRKDALDRLDSSDGLFFPYRRTSFKCCSCLLGK